MQIDWLDFNEHAGAPPNGAFQQSVPYAVAAAGTGAMVARAVVRDGASTLAWAQVLQRRGARLVLRGPIWADGVAARDQMHVVRRFARQAAAVLVMTEVPMAGFGLVPLVTPRFCALWSLGPGPDALRAGATGKWRNRMVSAARQGVEIRPAGPKALHLLIEAEAAQRQKRGYGALPPAFSMALPEPSLRLWHWHDQGRVHAAMCFVRHGNWATYHLGWADQRARAVGAHGLMLWQAALSLRAEGVATLDLGDVNTENAPGLARFKLGTGARLHKMGATCLVVPT